MRGPHEHASCHHHPARSRLRCGRRGHGRSTWRVPPLVRLGAAGRCGLRRPGPSRSGDDHGKRSSRSAVQGPGQPARVARARAAGRPGSSDPGSVAGSQARSRRRRGSVPSGRGAAQAPVFLQVGRGRGAASGCPGNGSGCRSARFGQQAPGDIAGSSCGSFRSRVDASQRDRQPWLEARSPRVCCDGSPSCERRSFRS